MKAMSILVGCAVVLLVLCVIAPIVVQNGVNDSVGNGESAAGNIQESLDNLNEKAESSALAEWLANLDEVNK